MTTAGKERTLFKVENYQRHFWTLKQCSGNGSIVCCYCSKSMRKRNVISNKGSWQHIYIFFKGGHPVCCYFLGRTPIWFFFSLFVPSEGGEIWTLVLTKETTECHWATRLLAGHPHVSLKNDDNTHNPFQFPLCLQSTTMSWLPHIIEQ